MTENSGQIPEKRRQSSEERGYGIEGEKMGGHREVGTGNTEGGKNRTKLCDLKTDSVVSGAYRTTRFFRNSVQPGEPSWVAILNRPISTAGI